MGVTIYGVGVGPEIDYKQLCTATSDDCTFLVDDFQAAFDVIADGMLVNMVNYFINSFSRSL